MIKVQNGLYQCCHLYKTRTNVVLFRGTATKNIDILFIGEAPGREEDLQGKPFVGRAGKLLDVWIKEAEIDNYAIINIVKCRPPNNRAPNKTEIRACIPHLIKQIHDLSPKLIVALGRISCSVLINRKELVPNIGKLFKAQFGKVFVMPHPAYILRGVYIDVPIEKLKMLNEEIKAERNNIQKVEGESNGNGDIKRTEQHTEQ